MRAQTTYTLTTVNSSNTHEFTSIYDYLYINLIGATANDTLFVFGGSYTNYMTPISVESFYSPGVWLPVITGVTASGTIDSDRMYLLFVPGGLKYIQIRKGYIIGTIEYRLEHRSNETLITQ